MAKVAVGIDIGGTNIRFGLVDRNGHVLAEKRTNTHASEGMERVVDRTRRGLSDIIIKAEGAGHEVIGACVGVPGIISHDEGIVRISPNLPGWKDVRLGARLARGLTIPVYVENDANAYALGEFWHGAGKGAGSLVCITLGTGVGGGIVLGGGLWRGRDGMAGEVGHLTVSPKGRPCPCGNVGCLEQYSSATAVVRTVGASLDKGTKSILSELYLKDPGTLTAEAIKDAAESGDILAMKVFKEAGAHLGIAIAGLINLLNIECVVIGGGMAGAWGLLIGPLMAEVEKRAFDIPAKGCSIVRGELGDDAGIIGSAGLVFRHTR